MSPTAEPTIIRGQTRVLGGITVVDTPLVTRAMELARAHSEPFLFHELRGRQDGYDVEDWLRVEDLLAHGSIATPRCSLTARGEST